MKELHTNNLQTNSYTLQMHESFTVRKSFPIKFISKYIPDALDVSESETSL